MKLRTFACLALVLCSTTAVQAKNPPKRAGGPPPPVWDRSGGPEDALVPAVFDGPALEVPKHAMMHGGAPADTVLRVRPAKKRMPEAQPLSVPTSPIHLYTSVAADWNDGQNMETAVYTMYKNAQTATTIGYMNRPPASVYHRARWTRAVSAGPGVPPSFSYGGQLPIAAGYTDNVDPWLCANPTTGGARPGAIYYTTLAGFRDQSSGNFLNPTAIRVYASDDNGASWSVGTDVRAFASGSTHRLDKPHADVSMYSATLGHLYIVWAEIGLGNPAPASRIMFRRNTNGLYSRCRPYGGGCITSWESTRTVEDGSTIPFAGAPQVVVNPVNGNVYVFYISGSDVWTNPWSLVMRRSSDNGVTWTGPIVLVSNIIPTYQRALQNTMNAVVVPVAKYNTGTGQVVVAWHEQTVANTSTNETALYFISIDADGTNGAVTKRLLANAPSAEIQPSFDNDDNGNLLFTYYKTDPSADLYQLYGVGVSAGGTIYTPALLNPPGESYYARMGAFLGDYHDTFFYSADGWPRWDTGWTRVDNGAYTFMMDSGSQ